MSSANANTVNKIPISQKRDKVVRFHNPKEILFPKVCVICGETAENQIQKTIFGIFEYSKDYKENYTLSIPICSDCSTNVAMKTGYSIKSGKILLFSSLIGLILSLSLYFVFYSWLLSISLIAITIVLPYLNYKAKTKNKLKLEDYLRIRLGGDRASLTFIFSNVNYANYIYKLNLKRESEEKPQGNN